jgi:malate dehydrogenase
MALGKPANDISAMVIGGHGDTTMIPLTRLALTMEFQCLNFFQKRRWKSSCRYYGGGATLTGLLEHQLGMRLERLLLI